MKDNSSEAPRRRLITGGSYMDGLDINLIEWCGLGHLSEEDVEKIYNNTNDIDLIHRCSEADIEEERGPDIVRETDIYIKVFLHNGTDEELEALKAEVKEEFLEILNESN
ncbi:hypothetical protein OAD33_03085 [Alphaproteobacteria bacterium]|nr:hypothetical protein [Alphaproteobacteria bacterium]